MNQRDGDRFAEQFNVRFCAANSAWRMTGPAGLRRSAELFRAFRIVRPLRRSLYRISTEQYSIDTNRLIPKALADFEQAKRDIAANPMLGALWGQRFAALPPGFLNLCQQTIDLSKEKVGKWLAQYMFKGKDADKAKQIADGLGNFEEHRTHGRPIGYDLAHEKGLNVTRLEDDQKLQEAVLSVFHATMVTFLSTQCLKIVENQNDKGHYVVAQLIMQPGVPAPAPIPPIQPATPPPTTPTPPAPAAPVPPPPTAPAAPAP